jgi:DNA-binding transcriptional LysR family regulator
MRFKKRVALGFSLCVFWSMDLRQLEVFLAVIEHRTVTRAAAKLYVSPGAVTLQLQNLARDLKTQLFVRAGKNILPTPAAMRLAVHAREVLRKVGDLKQDFGNSAALDRQPFHFASGATTLIYRLGRPLHILRNRYPHADLHVTVAPTEKIVAGLLDRHYDLGLISLPLDHAEITVLPLFEEELLVIRPLHETARPNGIETIRPAKLLGVPFLLYPPDSNMRVLFDRFFAEIGIEPRVTMEADDTEVIKRLVESGFGYSILPQFALADRRNQFQKLRVAGKRLVRRQALAMAKTAYPRPLTTEIAAVLHAALTGKATIHRG